MALFLPMPSINYIDSNLFPQSIAELGLSGDCVGKTGFYFETSPSGVYFC